MHNEYPRLTCHLLQKPELKTIKTMISSTDATPSVNSGVLVVVTGSLAVSSLFNLLRVIIANA